MTDQKLGLIGRDYTLIKNLTTDLYDAVRPGPPLSRAREKRLDGHAYGRVIEQRRGWTFEVAIAVDGELTCHVAKVTVELDRVDPELIEAIRAEQASP